MNAPSISIILAVYNDAAFVAASIDSILNQTWSEFELIIIDDGSTDGSSEILDAYRARDSRIRVITHEKNLGLPGSLNEAIAESTGDLIVRQDADDISHPERLAAQAAQFDRDPGIDLVATGHDVIDEEGRFCWRESLAALSRDEAVSTVRKGRMLFVHGTVMFRRALFDKTGGYNEDFVFGQDHELWLRALRMGFRFEYISDSYYLFRSLPSYSTRKRLIQKHLKVIRNQAYEEGRYPIRVEQSKLEELKAAAIEIPYPDASYYFQLAVMVIKRRWVSIGAWRYLVLSLRERDQLLRHAAKLPFFLFALYPFPIKRQFLPSR